MKINRITKVNIGKSGKRMLTLDELKKLRVILWIRIKHRDDKPNDPGNVE